MGWNERRRETMETHTPTREEALALLKEFNSDESLMKHALAVEAVMRYMARQHGEDEEKWGVIGLIHDLDYERYPERHCAKTEEILRERGWPEEYIRAVLSHAWGLFTDVEPRTPLEQTLYTYDELTGLITACVLVRPSRSILDLEVKSVKKKWKDKRFAAGVDRSVIQKGADRLGVERDEVIRNCIEAMREVADELGLRGQTAAPGEGAAAS